MYTILELQTTDGTTAANPPQYQEDRDKAMSVYHSILTYAALSEVEYHTVMVVDERGQYIARECYEHRKADPEATLEDEAVNEEVAEEPEETA